MRAPVKQLAILSAAAAAFTGAAGCDDALGNDKQVRSAIVDAREAAAKGEHADALQTLGEAAANAGASAAATAQAKAVLGAAELADAQRLMESVNTSNRAVARLVHEIGVLGEQIANSNLKMDRYRGLNPSEARAQAERQIAEIQGGGEKKVWIGAENAAIPTLAAVKQEISRLQGEIAKRQEEIKQLQQQRQAAAAEADKHREAADNAKGQQRVELVKQAAGAAKKAADLASQIEVVQAAVVPLQRDLALAQVQQGAATGAIESLKRQIESLDSGWKGVEQQIATQAQIATNVLGAAGAEAPVGEDGQAIARTINEKAAQLQQLTQQATEAFEKADSRLDSAITNYGGAVTAASNLAREANEKREGVDRSSPYSQAFDELLILINPAVYKLGQAEANQLRAAVNSAQGISLLGQQRMLETLQPVLAAAKLEMPESLNPQALPTEVDRTTKAASALYDTAAELYLEVSSEAPQELTAQNTARVGRIFSLYGKVLLARALGQTEQAQQFLAEATEARNVALENNVALPAMPVELIVVPTTQPATAPATAPAEPALTDPAAAPAPDAGTPGAPVDPAVPPADPAAPETPVEPATPPADVAAPTEPAPTPAQ